MTLLLGAAATVTAALLAALLLHRSRNERDAPPPGLGRALATNALGFLLLGSLAAGSGLLVDALCRIVQSQG